MQNFALVFILILTMGVGIYNNSTSVIESAAVTMEPLFVQSFNAQFRSYCGTNIRGSSVILLISLVESNNTQFPESQISLNITSTQDIDSKSTYTVIESYDDSTGIINEIHIYKN